MLLFYIAMWYRPVLQYLCVRVYQAVPVVLHLWEFTGSVASWRFFALPTTCLTDKAFPKLFFFDK